MLRYTKPDGTHGWRCNLPNGVTLQGVNWLLEVGFRAGTPSPALYLGLITNSGYLAVSPADTHQVHAGWSEWTALSSGTRPTWLPSAANGGLMGSTGPVAFNITADGSVRGAFLSTVNTVGSVGAGFLYNTIVALTGLTVANGGTVEVVPSIRIGE